MNKIAPISGKTTRGTKDAKVVEIVSPPSVPGRYIGNVLKPVINLQNTGSEPITSVAISYYVAINNAGPLSSGPSTTWVAWKGSLLAGQLVQVALKPFRQPLNEDIHYLEVFARQVDAQIINVKRDRMIACVFSVLHSDQRVKILATPLKKIVQGHLMKMLKP